MNTLKNFKLRKPYVLGRKTKYNNTSMNGHRVLRSGAIVVRTLSVNGTPVDDSYDAEVIKAYNEALKEA